MTYKSKDIPIRTQKELENMASQIEKLAANQDYIAMMTDVELEEEESEAE